MYKFLLFSAIVQLTVGSNVFFYKSKDGSLAITRNERSFLATLRDGLSAMNMRLSIEGKVLTCTRKALDKHHQQPSGKTGTIDDLIKFFIDHDVEVDK